MFPSHVEFCGQVFAQRPGSVIPTLAESPHTRALASFVRHLQSRSYSSLLDLGCGAGVLGISLWRKGVELVMSDCDPHCVELAARNAESLGVPARVVHGSWWEPVRGSYDLVIANPPHGRSSDWELFPWASGVIPHHSVDGGSDGLECIRAILSSCDRVEWQCLGLVCSADQARSVVDLAERQGLVLEDVVTVECSSLVTLLNK